MLEDYAEEVTRQGEIGLAVTATYLNGTCRWNECNLGKSKVKIQCLPSLSECVVSVTVSFHHCWLELIGIKFQ